MSATYDIYFWTTPNGFKVLLFAEEAELDYAIKPINIGRGDQFDPDFLRIAPNNRIPALVDHAPATGNRSLSIFESGAILLYLAEKTGRFIPSGVYGRVEVLQWLFWQVGGLGPMGWQDHLSRHTAGKLPYPTDRYQNEANRLYGVLDRRLADRPFVGGDEYTIADMSAYPWVLPEAQGLNIDEFANIKRWKETIAARPATVRAYAKGKAINAATVVIQD